MRATDTRPEGERGSMGRNQSVRGGGQHKGYPRNALYQLATDFKRHHPTASAAEAWRHFCALAVSGAHPILLTHDTEADALAYHPDPEKFAVAMVRCRSFAQNYYRIAI